MKPRYLLNIQITILVEYLVILTMIKSFSLSLNVLTFRKKEMIILQNITDTHIPNTLHLSWFAIQTSLVYFYLIKIIK